MFNWNSIALSRVKNHLLWHYFGANKQILASRKLNNKDKVKFLLRSPRHWKRIAQFFRYLKEAKLAFILEKHPSLLEKFSRPYLSAELSADEKLEKLLAHYRLLKLHFTEDTLLKFYRNGLPLCQFTFDEESFECVLEYDGQYQKEGEACISLIHSANHSKVFTLVAVFSESEAFIGCIQGGINQKCMIRCITKTSYGLRPHNLVFFVMQEVARALGCQQLYGVSKASHVYQTNSRTRGRIIFDYDCFWEELGGIRTGAVYSLPSSYPRNQLEDVPSMKRMLYRKRYALMDLLAKEISARMSGYLR